ncbi:MAG: hypothetical protein QOE41_3999 [Mycobacterium sp.]|jgi:hypothetical protein|nr:Uncharacterized protein [Mycobacterium sp.]MDT5134688.1 hypothetical protein [Mycobacterium sp.]
MLIAQDELMCHQLPTTFDHVQQSDLRWTERVVLYGFEPTTRASLMTGMARYPNRNVIDAYVMATVEGHAHVVRTSREISAGLDALASWQVGGYIYSVVEPLRQVQTVLEPGTAHDLEMDLTFTGTFPCYEQEPAFFRHRGRVDEDARRFYQNGYATGSVTVGDRTMMLGQDTWYFARDHSWGVRRGGGGGNLPEAAVLQPHEIPDGVLYFMGIFQFGDRVVHFAQREDADGRVWHYEGELLYPLSTGKPSRRITQVDHDFRFREQLPRVICGGEVVIHAADAAKDTISISPLTDFWPGFAGYDEYRGYASGFWRGPSYTDAFVVDTTDPSEVAKVSMLSETFCEVRCGDAIGHGLVEMVFMGRNDHYGYSGY